MLVQLRNVSASQKTAWDACQRKWHFQSVMKRPRVSTPAQLRGTGIHAENEHYLRTGIIRDSEWAAYVEAARPFLPPFDPRAGALSPGGHADARYIVEHGFWLPTVPGGPPWIGWVDLEIHHPSVVIMDYKTTSDFRYNKTPAELAKDTQLCCYAHQYYLRHPEYAGEIEVGHLYLLTKNKTPKAVYISATVSRQRAADQWAISMQAIAAMTSVDIADTLELPPNTASCGMYGGCDFRADCGLVPSQKQKPKEGEANMSEESFMDRLKRSVGVLPTNGVANGAAHLTAPPPVQLTLQSVGALQTKIDELRRLGVPAEMAVDQAKKALGMTQAPELAGTVPAAVPRLRSRAAVPPRPMAKRARPSASASPRAPPRCRPASFPPTAPRATRSTSGKPRRPRSGGAPRRRRTRGL